MQCVTPSNWDIGDVLDRGYLRLRQFHLHLITDSGTGISPVVRGDKATGGSRRYQRSSDLLDADAELPRKLSVDVHFDAWVIKRLLKLKIAQRRNLTKLSSKLLGIGAVVLQVRTVNCDLDRSGRAEVHRLAHNVSGFKGEFASGEHVGKLISQLLFKICNGDRSVRFEGYSQHSLLWPARPKEDRIDRICRRL